MSVKAINLVILIVLSIFFSCTSCKRDFSALEEQKECLIPTDTTSHIFSWTVDTLGENGSVLRAVSIISENEAWAGGLILRINKRPHTLVTWDGLFWNTTIPPMTAIYPDTSRAPINAIFVLNENNIYLINDNGEFGYWNREKWHTEYVANKEGNIHSIWGYSKESIYFAGLNGAITHYNGKVFKKQTTPSNVDLNHITGYTDEKTGSTKLWACGRTTLLYSENGVNWQTVWDINNPLLPDNFLNPTAIEVVGGCLIVAVYYYTNTRVYLFDPDKPFEYKLLTEFKSYVRDISGNSLNDIVFVGDENKVHHFNGKSTYFYSELSGVGQLLSISMKYNQVYIVGSVGSPYRKAVIINGQR